jgi:hypothetical protein
MAHLEVKMIQRPVKFRQAIGLVRIERSYAKVEMDVGEAVQPVFFKLRLT